MKILSEILSADPRPVALIVFFISALCGGVIITGHPSADFISDPSIAGFTALLSGFFGILFLIISKPKAIKAAVLIAMMLFYYLASALIISGRLYDSVTHLVLGLSMSWVFIHQSKICMNK
jgi:hypothetical protein